MAERSFLGHGRGGFALHRGRGRGRGRGYGAPRPRTVVKPDLVRNPLGELFQSFNVEELDGTFYSAPAGEGSITKCEHVASYSWTNDENPTIMVPGKQPFRKSITTSSTVWRTRRYSAYTGKGKPPLWTPLTEPQRLKEDSGTYFRDPNSAKFPTFPTEPAVRALFETDPNFATAEVDIFACGSTMGNLLRFVMSIYKPFRFNIDLVGSTLFLVRKENDPREVIKGVRGFGHTFPDAYTTWEKDVRGSETHQRLCRYELGRFNCVLRFECDGYLSQGQVQTFESSSSTEICKGDGLLGSFSNFILGRDTVAKSDVITLKKGGSVVPQHTIFDLKTRSGQYGRHIDMEDFYPQLWIRQIPNFIIAYHDGLGTFPTADIHVENIEHKLQAWEKRNKVAVQRLIALLDKIICISQQHRGSLLEVYCPSVDRIEIRKQHGEGVHALPPELMAKWEALEEDAALSNHENNSKLNQGGLQLGLDSDDEPDYTACGDDCGYCGTCTY